MKKYRIGNKKYLTLATIVLCFHGILGGAINFSFRGITEAGIAKDLVALQPYAVILGLLVLGLCITSFFNVRYCGRYLEKSILKVKEVYITKLLKQDITQLKHEDTPKYYTNLTSDMDRYETQYLKNILMLINIFWSLVVGLVMLAIINLWLVAIAAVLVAIFLWIAFKSSAQVKEKEEEKSKSLEKYTRSLSEALQGFEVIKSHQLEDATHSKFQEHIDNVQQDEVQIKKKRSKVQSLNLGVQLYMIFGIMLGGALIAKSMGLSVGDVVVIVAAFSNAIMPLQNLGKITSEMSGTNVVFESFDKNLERPEYDRPNSLGSFEELTLENCDLGYDYPILKDVNMNIDAKDKVLIIGPSGAGKSTILKTIRQSLSPLSGEVTTNGINAFSIRPQDYYDKFANVDQIGFLFDGNLKDNITLYQEANDKDIEDILSRVGLNEFSVGYSIKDNGANVSGGQRARMMIARALFFRSDILLCDEIFASLDEEVAKSIEKDMLQADTTLVNISHIVFKEHVNDYDKVFLVEDGKVELFEDSSVLLDRLEQTELLFN